MPLSINCPACREPLDVEDEYRTWKVRCPSCGHEFTPDAEAVALEEDLGEEATRPGPRRRRRRRMDDDEIIVRAKRAVEGPASWLRVTGMLGVLAGIGGGVLAGVMAYAIAENPAAAARKFGAANQEEVIVNTVLVGVCSAFSLVFGGLMAYGAFKMGRLESHGWSITSSVLAIASILFCTCCLFTGVPIGIWGLVTLARPEVQEGFAVVARRRQGRGWVDQEVEEWEG